MCVPSQSVLWFSYESGGIFLTSSTVARSRFLAGVAITNVTWNWRCHTMNQTTVQGPWLADIAPATPIHGPCLELIPCENKLFIKWDRTGSVLCSYDEIQFRKVRLYMSIRSKEQNFTVSYVISNWFSVGEYDWIIIKYWIIYFSFTKKPNTIL